MSPPITTPFGHPAPQIPGHENSHPITTHFPTWNHVLRFIERDPEIMNGFKSMYPRVVMQQDVRELTKAILNKVSATDKACLLFMAPDSAEECVEYATDKRRGDMILDQSDMSTRVFDAGPQRIWAVFFPASKTPNMVMFWVVPGVGISDRFAEEALKHVDKIREVSNQKAISPPASITSPDYGKLQQRIVDLLSRAPIDPSRKQPSTNDVYLFQTGMSAIYRMHEFLLKTYNLPTVLFGFPFHASHHLYDDFGPPMQFYGLADKADTDSLETWLESNKIQALFCEMPSNPLAVTPDLRRLCSLATKHDFILIVDDTIGSFCNIDVSSIADILMTSLTKSFSGYADVMGGSITLNPSLPHYTTLKSIMTAHYRNDLYPADATLLLSNSQDYLTRSTTLNRNTLAIATYFNKLAHDPKSCVTKVYHPSTLPSLPLYSSFMRPPTSHFTPGYGCLLTLDFATVACTSAFYDALNVHKAPHLGAHVTLALPYVKGLFAKQLEWVKQYDLRETMIRVAPGLEDEKELLEDFRRAVEAAERVWEVEKGKESRDGKVADEGVKGEDLVVSIS